MHDEKKNDTDDLSLPSPGVIPTDYIVEAVGIEKKQGLFTRLSEKFNHALHQSRGKGNRPGSTIELRPVPTPVEESTQRRHRNAGAKRMVIPENMVIEGSFTGGSETELAGKVKGDVHVEGALYLLKSAVVTGGVFAGSCQLDGLVEGPVEVSDNLVVGKTGKVNSHASAGRNADIAGMVQGNVSVGERLRILSSAVVNGDIRAGVLSMEDGATLNGYCTMRASSKTETNNNGKDREKL